MALSQEFVGRTYPAGESYQVGREKVREFATATGETSPLCHDVAAAREAGHPDLVAPVTFGIVVTMPAGARVVSDPELGLDYSRVVHGEQRFEYVRPVHAGDELSAVVTVESIKAMAGNDVLTSRTDVTDAAGEPVFSAWATLVARGTRMSTPDPAALAVGDQLPPITVTLHRADLVRYAGASGDLNVIHWNDRVATEVGLPGVIAHGMLTMAQAVRVVTEWAGDPSRVESYGVRFTRPIPVPDDDAGAVVEVGGKIREIDGDRVTVDIDARLGGQTVLAKARAVVRLG